MASIQSPQQTHISQQSNISPQQTQISQQKQHPPEPQHPEYIARKNDLISQSTTEPIEFFALDWYECDLIADIHIDKKNNYLNQTHNKTYNIFIFGVSSKGHSICLKVKNYLPYFYIQIPDDFTSEQINDLTKALDAGSLEFEDYTDDELEHYAMEVDNRNYKFKDNFKSRSRYYLDAINIDKSVIV